MKTNLIFLFLSFLLLTSFDIKNFTGKIVAVKDGDTYQVLTSDSQLITIRLAHVDCPEKKQAFGNNAKRFGSTFCFGKTVTIVGEGKYDRNHRLIAEIYLLKSCLNKELVKNGYAWHYKKYSKSFEYANLEIEARKTKIGLWQDEDATAPWEWRHH
jgi:micrococcal nuclease